MGTWPSSRGPTLLQQEHSLDLERSTLPDTFSPALWKGCLRVPFPWAQLSSGQSTGVCRSEFLCHPHTRQEATGPPDLRATLRREWRAVTPEADSTQLLETAFAFCLRQMRRLHSCPNSRIIKDAYKRSVFPCCQLEKALSCCSITKNSPPNTLSPSPEGQGTNIFVATELWDPSFQN